MNKRLYIQLLEARVLELEREARIMLRNIERIREEHREELDRVNAAEDERITAVVKESYPGLVEKFEEAAKVINGYGLETGVERRVAQRRVNPPADLPNVHERREHPDRRGHGVERRVGDRRTFHLSPETLGKPERRVKDRRTHV